MEPILKSYYNRFKDSFEIDTKDSNASRQQQKESAAFEKFINHVIFSIDDPDAFVSDVDMLDSVCIGGGKDTGIDGIGVRINGRLVASKEDVQQLLEISKKTAPSDAPSSTTMCATIWVPSARTFISTVATTLARCGASSLGRRSPSSVRNAPTRKAKKLYADDVRITC